MAGAQGVLVSISGGRDMTLFEIDEAVSRVRNEVADNADIIVGAIFDDALEGSFKVSVVVAGLDGPQAAFATLLDFASAGSGAQFEGACRRIELGLALWNISQRWWRVIPSLNSEMTVDAVLREKGRKE